MKIVPVSLSVCSLLACLALLHGAAAQTGGAPTTSNTPVSPSPQAGTCKEQAAGKKLAGAALTSFMNKCQKDATAACDKAAADKKLAGAAKTSFTKKCMTDSVGG